MKFGYSCDFGEIAPSIFRTLSAQKRTKLFLALYNSLTNKELNIPLCVAKSGNIKSVFKAKIKLLLGFKGYKKPSKIAFLDLASSEIINAYNAKKLAKTKNDKSTAAKRLSLAITNCAKSPALSAAKLISSCYVCGEFEMVLKGEDAFSNYVFEKIRQKQATKDVSLENGIIYIKDKGVLELTVMPSFADIDCTDQSSASKQIQDALKLIQKEPNTSVYVVAPRSPRFRKKIKVRHCQSGAGEIKIVPYTIVPNLLKGE